MNDNLQYVREHLRGIDRAGQLAEEASELCHAALKLQRVLLGTNPTPVTKYQAIYKVMEETADVLNALEVLGIYPNDIGAIDDIRAEKMECWVQRLKEKEAQHGS